MPLKGSIVFIGGGAMGGAIIKRLVAQETASPQQIVVSEPVAERRASLEADYGVRTVDPTSGSAGADVAADAAILVLAVKPQVIDKVMPPLAGRLAPGTLVISIMAGVRISTLRRGLAHDRIVRAMPNTPAQIGQGMTVWTATDAVSAQDKENAQAILSAMGDAFYVDDEHALDMTTGLSGSGPGFVFLLIEALIDAGVYVGFSRPQAERMVLQTIEGSVALMRQTGQHPADLRNRVTSPAGTTAAGILELERHNVRAALVEAVNSAYLRSKELGDLSEESHS